MRWLALLGLVCSCNAAFGIDNTKLVDAPPPIDARPDPVCPAIGTTPAFGTELNQVAARNCEAYGVSSAEGYAVAACMDGNTGLPTFAAAPVPEPLVAQTMTPAPEYPFPPRLAPEGDAVFITAYETTGQTYKTSEYRITDGTWQAAGSKFQPPNLPMYYSYTLSTPTTGPARRMMTSLYDETAGLSYVTEIEWNGTMATQIDRTELVDLGVESFDQPYLSPDGLRLIFLSGSYKGAGGTTGGTLPEPPIMGEPINPGYESVIYYTDRATTGEAFRKAVEIESVPHLVTWPHMTPDCGRIYFGALNTTWYLKQP